MGGVYSTLRRVATVVLVAMVLAPVGVAGAQTSGTGGTSQPPPVSCGNPPPGVTTTTQERDRFVGLWAPRVNDKAFLQSFLDAPAVPPAILAEGFHGLDAPTQGWLVLCLVDRLIATVGIDGNPPGVSPPPDRLRQVQSSLALVIFGKAQLAKLREQANKVTPVTDPSPSPTQVALTAETQALAAVEPAPPPDTSSAVPPSPAATSQAPTDLPVGTEALTNLLSGVPTTVSVDAQVDAEANVGVPAAGVDVGVLLSTGLNGKISFPVVDALIELVETLLQNALSLPATLLSRPPLNVLGGATYRVCRESAELPRACTIPIPVGVPVPVGLNNDLVPDVLAHLTPQPNVFALQDVTVGFALTRLGTAPPGPLPYHVFAVYDPPVANKRIEFGYDGRGSTIADQTNGTVTLKRVFSALQGDINVQFKLTHTNPGSVEATTVAVKNLVSQGLLRPLREEDPLAAAVQFAPVPATLTGDLRLRNAGTSNQTTLTLTSSVPTKVDANVTRDLTTTTPKSHQEIRGLIDKLPTNATVDLIRQGDQTKIHYFANAGIDHVSASDKLVRDITKPGSYTESIYDVEGVPNDVNVTLTGGSDVVYTASAPVPKASYSKGTFADGVLQTSILGAVEQVPGNIHLNVANAGDNASVTYDANASLGKASVGFFDRANEQTTLVAEATGFPTHIGVTANQASKVVDYAANGPIQQITAQLTMNGGDVLTLPGDHATILQRGTELGVEFVLSGLQAFHAEPAQKALYSLGLNPGGQPFKAVADLDDPNVLATLEVSNLPSTIAVTMDPAGGTASYDASSVIERVTARFDQRATGMVGLVELDDIPQRIDVTFATTGSTPGITYDASGKLGKIHAFYLEKPGGTSFDVAIESLPEWFKVAGADPFKFDARTGPNAPEGSSSLGKLTLKYASDGTFATLPLSHDRLLLRTAPATEAEFVYSGLRLVSASTLNKELHVDLRNTGKRDFGAVLDTPNLLVEGLIKGVPDEIKFDLVGQTGKYRATSPVDQVAVDIDRRNGESVAVDVTGIPASIDLTMDAASSTVDWKASAPTGGLGVVAKFGQPTTGVNRTFDTTLTLTGIPAEWKSSHAAGRPRFEGVTGPIGTLAATFTNRGAVTTLTGDHLSAVFDQPTGDLDTSLRISNLSLADFETLTTGSGGFKGDLNMGDGSPFGLNAQVNLGANRLSVTGTISNLPSAMHIESQEGRIQYTGNTNPTFQLRAEYGSSAGLAATPAPPSVHGLAVRDGDSAIKANLSLTGFPRVMDFDPKAGIYKVENFAPTSPLVIDAILDNVVSPPVTALVTQKGIPSGVNFTFGPTTSTTLANGTAQTHLGYVATAALGELTATATFGTNEAYFFANAVPQTLTVDTSFGADTKTVGVTLGTPIDTLRAGFRHVGEADFAASVELGDVPTTVNLTIGKQDGGQGVALPVFGYHASDDGLDLTAFARASLFGGDIRAEVDLTVTDFGKDVTAGLDGTTLSVASSPATGSFNLLASGNLNIDVNLGFDEGPLHNTGNLNIDLDIKRLNIAFTNLSSLTLRGGITSSIQGDYGTFTVGEESDLVLSITDRLVIDTGFGDHELFNIDPPLVIDLDNVVGNFRLATNHLGDWITALPTPVPCDVSITPPDIDFAVVTVELKPHPHETTDGPSFTVSGAAAEGGAHIVTINPKGALPDFVLDIIARFASPLGGDQGLGTACPD